MKKLIISYLFILFCLAANSQITKGYWLIGGSGKFDSYNQKTILGTLNTEWNCTNIDISPSVGYFLKDRVAFGVRSTFSSIKGADVRGGIRQDEYTFWIGPFSRYYFFKPGKQVNILTDISYQIGTSNVIYDKNKLQKFSAMVGPAIYLNNSVGLEFLLGYNSSLEKFAGGGMGEKYSKKGFQVEVGLQIHLKK
jgi:hypothetical protein